MAPPSIFNTRTDGKNEAPNVINITGFAQILIHTAKVTPIKSTIFSPLLNIETKFLGALTKESERAG